MIMLMYFAIIAVSVLMYVTLWYLYGQKLDRLDVADEAWGLAQPFIVMVAMLITKNYSVGCVILLILTFVWGYRLFSHIHKRRIKSSSEDIRYVEMRANWKRFPGLNAYFYVFLLQGLLMYFLASASIIMVFFPNDWSTFAFIGIAVWVAGFILESSADKQLKNFIAAPENKGKIMDQGLWKYSRHPNYFGEVIMWWGIFIFVFANTGIFWAVITPLTITYLIVFVSGIPLTEKHFETKPLWQEYKKKTSVLIPWPPKTK